MEDIAAFWDDVEREEHKIFRRKEIELADRIINDLQSTEPTMEAVYIPNPIPKKAVQYIFITMEPSFGWWARTYENAIVMLKKGFKNFLWSHDDMVFHYAIHNFLSPNYYITDISKIAMKVDDANEVRKQIYPLWIEHLKEEISLFGAKDYKVFFVGQQVEMAVSKHIPTNHIAGTLTHFSRLAAKKRNKIAEENAEQYRLFLQEERLTENDVLSFVKNLLQEQLHNSGLIDEIYTRIEKKEAFMNEAKKKLVFSFYHEFKQML